MWRCTATVPSDFVVWFVAELSTGTVVPLLL